MLPYIFRLALRHFSRKKIYSLVIVASLTVGFACTCVLVSFLIAETNADSFHTRRDRIFQLTSDDPFGGTRHVIYASNLVRDYFANNFPEVEDVCQIGIMNQAEIEVGENFTPIKLIEADPSFFSVFDFPSNTKSLNGLLVTSEKATQLFGTSDVLGREVVVKAADTTLTLVINGVIRKPSEKSHLDFDALVANTTFQPASPSSGSGGGSYAILRGGASYVLMHDATAAESLLAKVNSDTLRPTLFGHGDLNYYLEPLQQSYYSPANRMPFMQTRSETFIWAGWIVCGLLLFMASFNFINLFLLSMQERRKEQGIKKTLGISMYQTVSSLGTETLIYVVSSFVMALIVVYLTIPIFNFTLNTDLAFSYLSNVKVISIIGLSIFLLGIIALAFSVLQHRRVVPVSMMKGSSSKVRVSKLFFTLQFFVSITLCVCAITIVRQMNFIENEPLGFNRNILQMRLPKKESAGTFTEFKNRLLEIPGVEHATLSQGNPIADNVIIGYELEDGTRFNPYLFSGDEDYLATMDITLIEGTMDLKSGGKIVNEALVDFFGMEEPIGMLIPGTKNDRIVGVVKDFTCASFKQEIPPVIISYSPTGKALLIDYSQAGLDNLLPKVRETWNELFPDDYFDYRVLQQDLMRKYSEETLFYKIVVASSVVSMIISCFGLFALSWAVTRSRAKEMSIRKVLGANVTDILRLLTTSFAKRLAVAFVLATPAGYYVMNLWLSRFVYKVPVNGWIFVIAGLVLATITLVTLGMQTLKASLSSPLDDIRE